VSWSARLTEPGRRRLTPFLVVLIPVVSLLLVPRSGHALVAGSGWVERCAPQSPEHTKAATALEALSGKVSKMPDTADPKTVRRAFQSLLQRGCFELARRQLTEPPPVKTALGFKTWWTQGGEQLLFLQLYPRRDKVLKGGKYRATDWAFFPSQERRVLTRETHPKHRLADLLCRQNDAQCGRLAQAWARRADRGLERLARQRERKRALVEPQGTNEWGIEQCGVNARKIGEDRRYLWWLRCVQVFQATQSALPLGRFRPPGTGWLVLVDEGTHAGGCVTVRAYDIKTGAAYVGEGCGPLSKPLATGSKGATLRVELGTVSTDNAREALWALLLLADVKEQVKAKPQTIALPAHVKPRWKRSSQKLGVGAKGMGMGFSTHYRRWHWSWVRQGKLAASGTIRRDGYEPDSSLYAIELADLLKGLVSQCPAVPLPRAVSRAKNFGGISLVVPRLKAAIPRALSKRGCRAF
jgi:hypothetical protein